ncbi:MAG TPA: HAD-IA family hydrolase [Candidatus Saccharimonadales bacterium]
MIKAVVVDVDDTLCLTEAVCFDLENEVLQRMGREPMSRSTHKSTWGKPLFEAIHERSPGLDPVQFEKIFYQVTDEYVADGRLDTIPEENYAALDKLIIGGKDVMLLTSRTHGELKHMLAPDHMLATRVKAFYYRDIMNYHKPDPRAFDDLLKDHSLRPHECVYVGDSTSDAKAANEAGLKFIASLESGLRQEQDFGCYKVDAFVSSFPGIVDAISSIERL